MEELELSSREADELSGKEESLEDGELPALAELLPVAELSALPESFSVAELSTVSEPSPPLLSEEISSLSGPLTLALLLSSQAASVKVSAAAAMVSMDPIALRLQDDVVICCFMLGLLFKV
jgi:hypothetical protein